jgi:hypothetical protein
VSAAAEDDFGPRVSGAYAAGGPTPDLAIGAAARADPLYATYDEEVDRESAREKLGARLAASAAADAEPEAEAEPTAEADRAPAPARPRPASKAKRDPNPVLGYLGSREGRSMINTVARGIFGLLKKRR